MTDILIYSDIQESTAEEVARTLAKANGVHLRINSKGGDVTAALAIHARLSHHTRGHVTATIEGIAASGASLIAMAAGEIRVHDSAFVMIHEPRSTVAGVARDHANTASTLDRMANAMADIYAKRTGLPIEEIRGLMRAETWFTAAEAVEQGFADKIIPGERMAASADLSGFLNVPAALRPVPDFGSPAYVQAVYAKWNNPLRAIK